MNERKELILNTIIKEHIKTASPVGSGVLVEKYKLNISPATVRNEMAALEEEGYIVQPHTSAGRVPTEKAYKLYLENLKEKNIDNKDIENILKKRDEASFKEVAKLVSQISGNTVFWAFHKNNLYYTGISNLFQQPEFSQLQLIHSISGIIDRIDEIIDEMFEDIEEGEQVLIGSENPFGNFCSTVMAKYTLDGKNGIFGIIGPMRMDYEKNISLVKQINKLISE